MLLPKKNSYKKKFIAKKKFLRLENPPPPPHNFPNGLSLTRGDWLWKLAENYRWNEGCCDLSLDCSDPGQEIGKGPGIL